MTVLKKNNNRRKVEFVENCCTEKNHKRKKDKNRKAFIDRAKMSMS